MNAEDGLTPEKLRAAISAIKRQSDNIVAGPIVLHPSQYRRYGISLDDPRYTMSKRLDYTQ